MFISCGWRRKIHISSCSFWPKFLFYPYLCIWHIFGIISDKFVLLSSVKRWEALLVKSDEWVLNKWSSMCFEEWMACIKGRDLKKFCSPRMKLCATELIRTIVNITDSNCVCKNLYHNEGINGRGSTQTCPSWSIYACLSITQTWMWGWDKSRNHYWIPSYPKGMGYVKLEGDKQWFSINLETIMQLWRQGQESEYSKIKVFLITFLIYG